MDYQQFFTILANTLSADERSHLLISTRQDFAELRLSVPHSLLFYHCQNSDTPPLSPLTYSAAWLSALHACQNVVGAPPVNIQWLFAKNNFSGPQEWEPLTPDLCVCYFPAETGIDSNGAPILSTGTKGRLLVELQTQILNSTIDSMHAGIAPDSLWRLLWALGTLKDVHEDILIEGFYDTLTTIQDTPLAQLRILPDTTDMLRQHWNLPQLLMDLHGFQLHYAHLLLPTCTVSNITHDDTPTDTTLPANNSLIKQAKALVEFYLVPDQDPHDIFRKLQSHLRKQGFADIRARILSATRPLGTAIQHPYLQFAISATEKAYGRKPLLLPTTIGSYTLPPSWIQDNIPTIFLTEQLKGYDEAAFAGLIKQIALFIEGMTHGTDTTQ